MLAVCSSFFTGGESQPLDDDARTKAVATVHDNGSRGLRTLAVAWRALPRRESYGPSDETELTLGGWLTFSDPPMGDTDAMVAALARDGVALKILTGDDDAVAHHVCSATGIDTTHTALGTELDKIDDPALGALAERTTLFSRVSPQQKLRIILALKARGHVVGYIGDGINDAPSLHAADVGISVAGAVDVAKDAADIILLDRGLGVVHTGIIEGRKAFGNVMKYLLMGTSSNFGNMFSMAIASLIVPFLPMLPTQILLNNFLYDLSQIAIPSDRVDDVYIRKPHHWDMGILRQFMIRIGLVSSVFDLLTFAVLLLLFRSTPSVFRTGWFIESIVTQTLVLLVIRTTGNPFRSRPSGLLAATVVTTAIIGVLIPLSPLKHVLGFVAPPPTFLIFVVVATAVYLGSVEVASGDSFRAYLLDSLDCPSVARLGRFPRRCAAGQREMKGRRFSRHAVHPHASAVRLDETFRDVQPQPESGVPPSPPRIDRDRPNRVKILGISSSEIPFPSLVTEISTSAACCSTCNRISPCGSPYLAALLIKLPST